MDVVETAAREKEGAFSSPGARALAAQPVLERPTKPTLIGGIMVSTVGSETDEIFWRVPDEMIYL